MPTGEDRTDTEPLRALVGVTAAGKTELALRVAERAGAEILSMDSMLVYRGMDVGTAKPSGEERARVPHHLIDVVEPGERYDVQRYLTDFAGVEADLERRGARGLAVGGTCLYLQALVRGMAGGPPVDPALRERLAARAEAEGNPALHAELARVDPTTAERVHPNDRKRVLRSLELWEQTGRTPSEWRASSDWGRGEGRPRILMGVSCDEPRLTRRIEERTRRLLEGGWVEEARALREAGGLGPTAVQALGYREVFELLDGKRTRAEAQERISLRTRQFARRQRTWLRRFPEIEYVEPSDPGAVARVLERFGWGPPPGEPGA